MQSSQSAQSPCDIAPKKSFVGWQKKIMLVQFGNNWIKKIPLTAQLHSAYGLWLSSEFFSSNYFQIGQHVVLLNILIIWLVSKSKFFSVSLTRNIVHSDPSVCSWNKITLQDLKDVHSYSAIQLIRILY